MDLENQEFRLFAKFAEIYQLKYMVIGGFAMYLNGLARSTDDVDVWVEPTAENGQRLFATLLDMGYTEDELDGVKALDFTQPVVFGINNYIDVLTRVHHKFNFSDCYSRARSCRNPDGHLIHFLHLNDLREQKVVARREQDLRDIIQIDNFLKLKADRETDAT